jgi:hypothetical protein
VEHFRQAEELLVISIISIDAGKTAQVNPGKSDQIQAKSERGEIRHGDGRSVERAFILHTSCFILHP